MAGDKKAGKKAEISWVDIRAIFVAVFAATIIKGFVFQGDWIPYSIWTDLLVYMALFLPINLFMLFIQGKFRKDKDKK